MQSPLARALHRPAQPGTRWRGFFSTRRDIADFQSAALALIELPADWKSACLPRRGNGARRRQAIQQIRNLRYEVAGGHQAACIALEMPLQAQNTGPQRNTRGSYLSR